MGDREDGKLETVRREEPEWGLEGAEAAGAWLGAGGLLVRMPG